ncbi:MAG: tRNA-dihydrouridine synthase, partial [Solirubrobacterales bacterium]
NMGCPVPKVVKTGAGAALIAEPERAIAIARAAAEGSGLPVTVKLRSGLEPGDSSGVELARRLVAEAGVAAIALHPRPAAQHHTGIPDLALVRELVGTLDADAAQAGETPRGRPPVIVTGGLRTAERARRAYEESGADAVMIARGSLGNPWIFTELTRGGPAAPEPAEVVAELRWLISCAEDHWGPERAGRNLRKLYPWYLERLGVIGPDADRFQRAEGLDRVREMLGALDSATPERPLTAAL